MNHGDLERIAESLASRDGVRVRREVPLSENTTWRIGGPARLWIDLDPTATGYESIAQVIECLQSFHVPFTVVGGGSNILGADEGYDGAVIHLMSDEPAFCFSDHAVEVSAGALLSSLVTQAAQRGWADLEFLTGIPGTVGGALAMNAGTGDQWICSVVDSVTALVFAHHERFTKLHRHRCDDRPSLVVLDRDELTWDYRAGSLRDAALILSATLRLTQREDPEAIALRIRERLARRRAGQPLDYPSAGSVFRNPEKDNAWRLIDAAGLKGMRIGDAQISERHTNFIINHGEARAAEVLELIETAQKRVFEEYGVRLQKEVRVLGPEA